MNLAFFSSSLPSVQPVAISGPADFVLGGAVLGEVSSPASAIWPQQVIAAPLLGATAAGRQEGWLCSEWLKEATAEGEFAGIAWRRAGDLLYGVLELAEADFTGTAQASALQQASQEAYRRIFRLLARQNLPHLWRVWNYLADINGESAGLERYRQFNIGRQDAFIEFQRGATGNVPAACAIGLAGGPLSIAFMAGATPALPLENPRQVSAYHYPADYGPRSPTFSRAALVYLPMQEILFVSGTASIVGHQTVHPGDVAGQCRESLANIAAVVAEANRQNRSAPYTLASLSYRVYIRRAEDFAVVAQTLTTLLAAGTEIVYLQADVCRYDLLLEIEAQAFHMLEHS